MGWFSENGDEAKNEDKEKKEKKKMKINEYLITQTQKNTNCVFFFWMSG